MERRSAYDLSHTPVDETNLMPIRSIQNRATAALLVATVGWGGGFTWAKVGGRSINQAMGVGIGTPLGPVALLAIRFLIAGSLWFLLFPASRQGWSWKSVGRAMVIGVLLAIGLGVQHLGLDRTTAAVSAFLTSLTIVFVPLLSTITLRKSLSVSSWLAVVVATSGVWVMTGMSGFAGLGIGEWLGLICALDFSIYILVVNYFVPRDDPFRMTGGQFLVVGLLLLAIVPMLPPSYATGDGLRSLAHTFSLQAVWLNGTLLILFSTVLAYGLLTHYQPKLDATRAALIYLLEPIFASVYAWLFGHEPMSSREILGATIILFANVMIEIMEVMRQRRSVPIINFAPREPAS